MSVVQVVASVEIKVSMACMESSAQIAALKVLMLGSMDVLRWMAVLEDTVSRSSAGTERVMCFVLAAGTGQDDARVRAGAS